MPSIVEQIQRDALDRDICVSDLLRRVKLAAAKLDLGTIEDWVEHELNGYNSNVPEYRMMHGEPMALNPRRERQPIAGKVERISRRANCQSIAEIEDLVRNADEKQSFHIAYDDELAEMLNQINKVHWTYFLVVGRSQFVGILDRVRNLVLDWAIDLERAGITGTELSFNTEEKQKAQAVSTTINIGQIGAFAGNLGTANTTGNISTSDIDLAKLDSLIRQLKPNVSDIAEAGANKGVIQEKIEALQTQLKQPKPQQSQIRGLLTDLRNSLSGATGNLIASGAIHLLNQMLGTGMPSP